jgi:gliding motility-associated-like protein
MMRIVLLGLLSLWGLCENRAQDCTPAPGPAIFLEDFGSGPNPGPALPLGRTGFIYGTLNPGGYVISNTSDLNPRNWLAGEDHTSGDENGYMLILNADSEEGLFYQRTVPDVCPNTDYVFTYHLANLMEPTACIGNPVPPQVRLRISDANSGTILLDTTPRPVLVSSRLTWREFTFSLRTDAERRSLLIRLTNVARPGCGNDLALDDISLRLCNPQLEQSFDLCSQTDGRVRVGSSIYTEAGIYQDALPIPNSCNDTLVTTIISGERRVLPALQYTFCAGDTLEVAGRRFTTSQRFLDTLPGPDPNCPGFQPYELIAQPPQVLNQDITLCRGDSLRVGNNWYHNAGTYVDSLRTFSGCDSIVRTSIEIAEIGVELSPASSTLELGERIALQIDIISSTDYRLDWRPQQGLSCTDCLNPLLTPAASGTYQLITTDRPSGCQDSASIQVTVLSCEAVFVPNAFSPNFDRVNDQLELYTEDCFTRLVSWQIFNRWGGQVYELREQPLAGSALSGWDGFVDGQPAASGVYSYQLIVERNNGSLKRLSGEVILLR